MGALRALGGMSRGAHSFPLHAGLLGTAGAGWLLVSSWWSPGGDGEQSSVGGSFEAGGKRQMVSRGGCTLGTITGTTWLHCYVRSA